LLARANSFWKEQESSGILRNPQESGGIRSKYPGIPGKNSSKIGKKQEFLRPPPKPSSCEKILRKTQEKKKS
jgi:hypothetical protein